MLDGRRRMILNADDLGYSPGVSAGIIYAHRHGVLTSTTAMVNTAFAKQGVEEAKCFPELGIGLHFVLDVGRPISSIVNSLTDENGWFLKGEQLIRAAKKDDIKQELEAQLHLLLEWGVDVTHIDSHHHMHTHIPEASEAVTEVAHQLKLPVRSLNKTAFDEDVSTTDQFNQEFYGKENISPLSLMEMISNLQPGVTEVMCHPAFLDTWLLKGSSYNATRMEELETLTAHEVWEHIQKQQVELIHYGGLS